MVSIMEQLREKVKELRKKKGWTQEDSAREICVSLSTIQRWEKKGGKPTQLARRELRKFLQEAGIDDELWILQGILMKLLKRIAVKEF